MPSETSTNAPRCYFCDQVSGGLVNSGGTPACARCGGIKGKRVIVPAAPSPPDPSPLTLFMSRLLDYCARDGFPLELLERVLADAADVSVAGDGDDDRAVALHILVPPWVAADVRAWRERRRQRTLDSIRRGAAYEGQRHFIIKP